MKTILIYSESDLSRDPRVVRQILTLKKRYKIVALGTKAPLVDKIRYIQIESHGIAAGTPGKFLSLLKLRGLPYALAYATCWAFERLLIFYPLKDFLERKVLRRKSGAKISAIKSDLIIANDLSALSICTANAMGRPILYDAHEYSPGQYTRNRKTLGRRKYAIYILYKYLRNTAGFLTVGRKIAERYILEYGVEPVLLTNAPEYQELVPSTSNPERIRLVHHGIAARGRALENMIKTVKLLDNRFSLDFYLMSNDPGYLDELKMQAKGDACVRFLTPVSMDKIASTLNAYDVGIYLLPPTSVNQKLALPNKIFEFIQARLAIAVGPSPEMSTLIRERGIGVVASSFSPESMASALQTLDAKKIEVFKKNSNQCARELSSETNARILHTVVEQILKE